MDIGSLKIDYNAQTIDCDILFFEQKLVEVQLSLNIPVRSGEQIFCYFDHPKKNYKTKVLCSSDNYAFLLFDDDFLELVRKDPERVIEEKKITALVVDDSAFLRKIMKDILTRNQYEIIGEASNGLEAISKYQEKRPDFVTLDITMPEMDGITALKMIKSMDKSSVIIICSSIEDKALVVEALKNGASDFFVKPYVEAKIVESLNKLVKPKILH